MSLTPEPSAVHETGATPPFDWETFCRYVRNRGRIVYNVSWRHRCELELKLPLSFLIVNLIVRKLELIVLAVTVYLTFTGVWLYSIVGFLIWYIFLFPLKRKSVAASITLHAAEDREYFDLVSELGTLRLE